MRFSSYLGPPVALLVVLGLGVPDIDAGIINSPGGNSTVGINPSGSLFDGFGTFRGFRRNADGYDPVSPGTPHDGWGASLGGIGGRAQPFFLGDVNLSVAGAPVFGANSASLSHFIGGAGGLRVAHSYTFAAENVLRVAVTLTNLTGASANAVYRRLADWDITPSQFAEIISSDPLGTTVSKATFQGFQSGNPLDPWGSLFGAGGGVAGPGDFGGGFELALGSLAPGGSFSFDFLYGISSAGQTEAGLRAQLEALGYDYVLSGRNAFGVGQNAVAYALQIPEPATLTLCGLLVIGLAGYRMRRRRAMVA